VGERPGERFGGLGGDLAKLRRRLKMREVGVYLWRKPHS